MPLKNPHHVLLLFIDGLGIGTANPAINPCCAPGLTFFNHFQNETFPKPFYPTGLALGLDANLGVAGLPQSATGQTALLTGVNAAAILGRHKNGFPNDKLRKIIAEHGILSGFSQNGYKTAFLNTFRPPFFDYDPYAIIRYLSVTTVTNLYAGLPFFNLDDLRQEKSVYHDITNQSVRDMGFDVPLFSPEKAGEIIGRQTQNYHFTLFEYFQTDQAGHSLDLKRAIEELFKLERFLNALLEQVDFDKTLVIVTSDHGNIEDISFKGHTRNPVMTLVFGKERNHISRRVKSITDIVPAIKELFFHSTRPDRPDREK